VLLLEVIIGIKNGFLNFIKIKKLKKYPLSKSDPQQTLD